MEQRKERPILFSGAMVRAILDGRKTQTRRVLKVQPPADTFRMDTYHHPDGQHYFWAWKEAFSGCELHTGWEPICCPYGQPGDRLWVREAFMHEPADYCWEASVSIPVRPATTIYRADSDPRGEAKGCGWKPSIHMPRALSRITLEITGVRVERLNDCSQEDAIAEGIAPYKHGWERFHPDPSDTEHTGATTEPRLAYKGLWESINGAGSWAANPWVWVVEFKRL